MKNITDNQYEVILTLESAAEYLATDKGTVKNIRDIVNNRHFSYKEKVLSLKKIINTLVNEDQANLEKIERYMRLISLWRQQGPIDWRL